MQINPEIYYQTTVSKTKFYPGNVDQEDVGLADYRKTEREAILKFVESTNDVMLCGGLGCMGKTHTMMEVFYKNQDFERYRLTNSEFSDLLAHSSDEIKKFTSNFVAELAQCSKKDNPKYLLFDEGLILTREGGKEKAKIFLSHLRDHFEKLIIFGGSTKRTAQEQNEKIKDVLPASVKIELNPFEFKNLNSKQTGEYIDDWYKRSGVTSLPPDILNILIDGYLEYFRILGFSYDGYERNLRFPWKHEQILERGMLNSIFIYHCSPYGTDYMTVSAIDNLEKELMEIYLKTREALQEKRFLEIIDGTKK